MDRACAAGCGAPHGGRMTMRPSAWAAPADRIPPTMHASMDRAGGHT
jgi:hypothetical protein